MSNVIKVDFQRERRKEQEAFVRFEEVMKVYHQKQRLKLAFLMVGFGGLVIVVMLVPFVVSYLTRNL